MALRIGSIRRRTSGSQEYPHSSGLTTPAKNRKKLVIVGSGNCGKTSLLLVKSKGIFPESYVPTLFENYITKAEISPRKFVELILWDTAGQEDYDRLRPLSYPDTDVLLIVFSVADRNSFTSVTEKWYPETYHFLKDVPRILVGTKVDLRNDHENGTSDLKDSGMSLGSFVTTEEGKELCYSIGADMYIECSAKTGYNVEQLFVIASKLSIKSRKRASRARLCGIL